MGRRHHGFSFLFTNGSVICVSVIIGSTLQKCGDQCSWPSALRSFAWVLSLGQYQFAQVCQNQSYLPSTKALLHPSTIHNLDPTSRTHSNIHTSWTLPVILTGRKKYPRAWKFMYLFANHHVIELLYSPSQMRIPIMVLTVIFAVVFNGKNWDWNSMAVDWTMIT